MVSKQGDRIKVLFLFLFFLIFIYLSNCAVC